MRDYMLSVCLLFLMTMLACAGCSGSGTSPSAPHQAQLINEVQAQPAPGQVDPVLFDELKAELVRVLNERGVSKIAATPPMGSANVITDLVAIDIGGPVQLTWTHKCAGDYNNDGEVTVSDLTPVGIYYNAKAGDANWGLASAADGNNDGFITVSDITAIGQNYGVATRGYSIFGSHSATDYPAGPDDANGNGASLIDSTVFATGMATGTNRKQFSYTIAAPMPGDVWWVRPYDDAVTSGARSVLAQIGGAGFLTLNIDPLSLEQPTGGTGSQVDPYTVHRTLAYALQAVHSADGDVSLNVATNYQSSDPGSTVDGTATLTVGGSANSFNITAFYLGATATLYFNANPSGGSATFGMDPVNPALGGVGTVGDPFQLNTTGSFNLQVIDTTGPTDVTGQAVFTISEPASIQTDPTGFIVIDPLFSGTFNIGATFNSQPTSPATLYFTVGGGGPNDPPSALFDFVSSATGIAPFDLMVNASPSSDSDGTIVLYEWDVAGNSDFDVSTTLPLLEYSYSNLTLKDITLRVTDNDGDFGEYTHPTQVDIAAANPVSIPLVSTRGIHDCAIAEIDGVANIAITGPGYVDFHRSTDDVGTAFTSELNLDSATGGFVNQQAVALGSYFLNEILVYCAQDTGFDPAEHVSRAVIATNGDGTGWENIGTTVDYYSYGADIAVDAVDNGINVYQVDEFGRMMCFRSTDGGATYPSEYIIEGTLSLLPDFGVNYLNTPVCAYGEAGDSALYFRKAQDNAGTNWSSSASLIQNEHFPSSIGLITANGVPAVVYVDVTNFGSGSTPIYYSYAYDANGTSWSTPQQIADPGWTTLRKIGFTTYMLKPVMVYQDGVSLMLCRAHDRLGTRWAEPYALEHEAFRDSAASAVK